MKSSSTVGRCHVEGCPAASVEVLSEHGGSQVRRVDAGGLVGRIAGAGRLRQQGHRRTRLAHRLFERDREHAAGPGVLAEREEGRGQVHRPIRR